MSATLRIISLLPSATEICFALGLEENLVGVTHECDFPPEALTKQQVTYSEAHEGLTSKEIDELVRSQLDERGSIYELDLQLLNDLRPELILTQRLCTVCAVSYDYVAEKAKEVSSEPQVINLEPVSLEEVFTTITEVARLANAPEKAERVLAGLRSRISCIHNLVADKERPKVLVLEWVDPPFASGHWIPELVEIAGGDNSLGFKHRPSRQVTWEQIVNSKPEIIVVAECGFGVDRQKQDLPLLQKRLKEAGQSPEIWICDGSQYFSRPGPRLVDTAEIVTGIIHPDLRENIHQKFIYGKDFIKID